MAMETILKSSNSPRIDPFRMTDAADKFLLAASAPISSRHHDADVRHHLIEKKAYLLAASRGFSPGSELDDWLRAEAEVDRWYEGEHYSGD